MTNRAPNPKAILVILDGFGLRETAQGNAIKAAKAPTLHHLLHEASHTHLETSGEAVGLPAGQMGNSEVGHMNIGAGRVIYQMLTRIDKSIREGAFQENPVLTGAIDHALRHGSRLHLMGLVSDGGVHSSQEHLHALIEVAKRKGLTGDRVAIHAFTDGRDTSPTGGKGYLAALETVTRATGAGVVATVSGRYFAMDRDKRWDRTQKAWQAMVHGEGPAASMATDLLEQAYASGVTDEFIPPTVVRAGMGVREDDAVIYFNFRPDRARQLTRAFTQPGFKEFDTGARPRVHFASMTQYDETFTTVPFAFADVRPSQTLGEVVSKAGLRQLRVAETEKYAHVTYFLNGGEEKIFPGEDRILVQSPKDVPTYDHKPEMSAVGVTDETVRALETGDYSLVVMNYANCDMVGHTGDFQATVRAVETVDACLGRILESATRNGFQLFVTADHGNAEEMVNADGTPQTAHTTLPVPFAYVGPSPRKLRPGILADVAPTLLKALDLPIPKEMTGKVLFAD